MKLQEGNKLTQIYEELKPKYFKYQSVIPIMKQAKIQLYQLVIVKMNYRSHPQIAWLCTDT